MQIHKELATTQLIQIRMLDLQEEINQHHQINLLTPLYQTPMSYKVNGFSKFNLFEIFSTNNLSPQKQK